MNKEEGLKFNARQDYLWSLLDKANAFIEMRWTGCDASRGITVYSSTHPNVEAESTSKRAVKREILLYLLNKDTNLVEEVLDSDL